MCISKGQVFAVFESSFENLRKLPVYSVLDVTEDVVDPFSQSFSPFLLLERLGDRKPSAESGLQHKCKHKISFPDRYSVNLLLLIKVPNDIQQDEIKLQHNTVKRTDTVFK